MRTYVRVRGREHPPRRPRLVLRVGRAARRPGAARAAGDRRRRRGPGRELRGQGVRRAHGDGRAAGAAAVPGRRRRLAADRRVLEASKAVFAVFEDTTPLVEGLSIDEAFLDVARAAAHRRHAASRSPRGCGATVLEQVGLPITVGVARTKFLAKVASGVAKPDGLLRRAARPRARVPPPAAGRAAVGRRARSTAAKLRDARDHDRGRGRAAAGGGARRAARSARRAATCTRWRTTATRAR